MDKIDFTGKVAVVTGASRGIGRQLALGLAKRGATVVGTARSMDASPGSGGTLRETIDMITSAGGKAIGIPCQIAVSQEAGELISRAYSDFGRVDVLVNNAGSLTTKPLSETTDEEWAQLYAVNVNAPFYLIRAVQPIMQAQRSGNIFNVTSGSGTQNPRPDQAVYSSTKAAVDRMTWVLAHELREYGIAVNSWWPGVIATDMTRGRLPGDPVEVVEESAMWIMAQTPDTFTARTVRRGEFGKTWGQGPDQGALVTASVWSASSAPVIGCSDIRRISVMTAEGDRATAP